MDKPTCRKPRFYNIEKERESMYVLYIFVKVRERERVVWDLAAESDQWEAGGKINLSLGLIWFGWFNKAVICLWVLLS